MLNLPNFRSVPNPNIEHQFINAWTGLTFDMLKPLRQWLNHCEIASLTQARWICRLVPAQCPFQRDIQLGQFIQFEVPPLCKLNPLYEEVVSLRFRALGYLADNAPDDVCRYC